MGPKTGVIGSVVGTRDKGQGKPHRGGCAWRRTGGERSTDILGGRHGLHTGPGAEEIRLLTWARRKLPLLSVG